MPCIQLKTLIGIARKKIEGKTEMGLQVMGILELSDKDVKIIIVKEKNGKMENQKTRIHTKKLNGIPQFKNTIIEIKEITKDSLKSRTGPSRK